MEEVMTTRELLDKALLYQFSFVRGYISENTPDPRELIVELSVALDAAQKKLDKLTETKE